MDNKYQRARELRKNSTPHEQMLWRLIRNRNFKNYKFRRQYPIGNYIVDFICREKRLIIELDGGQHNEENNINYDKLRTEFLNNMGYKILRIWNNDIENNIEGVMSKIESYLDNN